MSSVDISSVENISVLKDASATAVYGVKGANGVILITTKRGKEGKANVQIKANMTAKVVSKLPEKYDAYDTFYLMNNSIEREACLNPAGGQTTHRQPSSISIVIRPMPKSGTAILMWIGRMSFSRKSLCPIIPASTYQVVLKL